MPTWPFSPHTTFSDNTVPKVTATHINEWEAAHNALFWAVYLSRPQCRLFCTDGATVGGSVSPMLIKDAATSKYVYVAAPTLSLSPADLETPTMAWPVSTWLYIYIKATNGVAAAVVSTTAPVVITPDGVTVTASALFKNGDETKRYICSFYSDGSSVLPRFHRIDNVTTYIDEAMVVPTSAGITTWQAVSLATYVPAHAVEVELCGMLDNYAATYRSLYLTFTGDAPAAPRGIITRADSFNSANLGVYLIGAGFRWKTDSNAIDHEVRVAVRGWKD